MSVFSRLSQILRAQLGATFHREPDWDIDDVFFEELLPSERSGSQARAIDPELARYYANLEVPYGSDLATVRRAWKQLLRKYHPDLHSNDPEKVRIANELVQGLNQAYEALERRLGGGKAQ